MATLINLLVCAIMLLSYAAIARNTQNELIREELKVTCNLSAEILEHSYSSSADRVEYLIGLDQSGALGDAYVAYIEDGFIAYRNFDQVDEDYLNKILSLDQKGIFVTERKEGHINRIAVVQYIEKDDSCLICFSKPSAKLFSMTGSSFAVYAVLVILAILKIGIAHV